jgi:membrane-associated phospholipid phosphatase
MRKFTVLFFSVSLLQIKLSAQNFDINTLKPINKKETTFKNTYLNTNADLVTPLSFGIPTAIAIAGFVKHDKKLQKDALYMAGSYITSAVVTYSIKHIVKRERPYQQYAFIIQRADAENNASFPSGHTSAAFCTATAVALRYHQWYFVAPAYIYATSVAWARMYQGVHYPSDVFTGALVGAGTAWLGFRLQRWMEQRQVLKTPTKHNW